MKVLNLVRFAYAPTGTFGYFVNGLSALYTVERPWLDNQHGISCIPEGTYLCVPRHFNKGDYNAVEITNVPNRQNILFHIANFPSDVEGCIGVGNSLGALNNPDGDNQWCITGSKVGFKAFMDVFGSEPFQLNISQIAGANVDSNGSQPRVS